MAEYMIRMADERGHVMEQVEPGNSEGEVRERFAQQGFLVYWVKPKGLLSSEVRLPTRRKIRQDQFVIFNQQFVTLIHAGLPIIQSLELLMKRQRNPFFRKVLQDVRDRVRGGELLSEAFVEQKIFPKVYTTTLLAGEKSGNLEEVLGRYIAFQRLALSFRKKLVSSLVYPVLLVVMLAVMLTFLITFVVPQFANLYNQLGVELPPLTTVMLAIGTNAQHYAPYVAVALVIAGFLIWRWMKSDAGATQVDRVKLKMPLLGGIWLKYQVAVFSRMLSTLLAGGLPLVPALETAGESMQSHLIAHGVESATRQVREGQPLARSLEAARVFPPMSVEMIEVGESTGSLPAMLNSVAEFYEEDVNNALATAMALIEPIILIVMGVVVAFVLISLYLPIFSLGAGAIH
ncbi:MAG TPA: type II secretion system F family protein [Candidatus Eisenbacteria bacterium]|nr:type II secretion system F family protein [Candidatus Eisenbacteria bacterium]